ncbi:hypothetical protein [Agromyces larvae]|uniref:Uncharacterized protein n=1 Tax=Agromyces larvae TaxID=2929802 RepID=A0ABY4BV41_9MICO|nr:hypothetical protein [Agromyces larvae]UOE43092.1 hypothetical protein MTO99_12945 [Agromyces larvae]
MNWLMILVGALLMAVGIVWTLQGFGVLPGSAMSGVLIWAIVGPVVEIVGLLLLIIGIARLRRR